MQIVIKYSPFGGGVALFPEGQISVPLPPHLPHPVVKTNVELRIYIDNYASSFQGFLWHFFVQIFSKEISFVSQSFQRFIYYNQHQ